MLLNLQNIAVGNCWPCLILCITIFTVLYGCFSVFVYLQIRPLVCRPTTMQSLTTKASFTVSHQSQNRFEWAEITLKFAYFETAKFCAFSRTKSPGFRALSFRPVSFAKPHKPVCTGPSLNYCTITVQWRSTNEFRANNSVAGDFCHVAVSTHC